MVLVKVGHESELRDGAVLKKVVHDQTIVLKQTAGQPCCYVVRPEEVDIVLSNTTTKPPSPVYKDNDGSLWVMVADKMPTPTKGPKFAEAQIGEGFGLGFNLGFGSALEPAPVGEAPLPLPLLPFAGLVQKPMPPSAEKQQQEARDLPAHSGVVRKLGFGASDPKQTRMSDFFAKGHNSAALPVDMDF